MSKVNYSEILREYLTDPTSSYSILAKKYHISKQSIVMKAKKDGWQQQRREFQQDVERKFTNSAKDQLVEAKKKQLKFANLLISKAVERLKKIKPKELSPHMVVAFVKTGIDIENSAFNKQKQQINLPLGVSPIHIENPHIDSDLIKNMEEIEINVKDVQFEQHTLDWLDEQNKEYYKTMGKLL